MLRNFGIKTRVSCIQIRNDKMHSEGMLNLTFLINKVLTNQKIKKFIFLETKAFTRGSFVKQLEHVCLVVKVALQRRETLLCTVRSKYKEIMS